MTYLHCARCKLAIQSGLNCVAPSTCPRCQARAGIASPLFASDLNGVEMRAKERARRRTPRKVAARPMVGYMRDRDGDAAPIFAPRPDDHADTPDGLFTR
jgi:tRNA G26 N,N-dimethylase Trm1